MLLKRGIDHSERKEEVPCLAQNRGGVKKVFERYREQEKLSQRDRPKLIAEGPRGIGQRRGGLITSPKRTPEMEEIGPGGKKTEFPVSGFAKSTRNVWRKRKQ